MTNYQVRAVRFATSKPKRSEVYLHFAWHGVPDEEFEADFYFWVITGGDQVILLDTGFTEAVASARGFNYLATMSECLRALDLGPNEVTAIVHSHLHFDHTGNLDLFPAAEILVQRNEIEFWNGPIGSRTLFAATAESAYLEDLRRADVDGRVRRLDGECSIAPGIDVLVLPGHTPGQQGLRIQTDERPVVLAADAAHFADELEHEWPFLALDSISDMYRTYDRLKVLRDAGDVVVPGHAHETLTGFSSRSFGDGGAVVELR